jgi:hypothetical protein
MVRFYHSLPVFSSRAGFSEFCKGGLPARAGDFGELLAGVHRLLFCRILQNRFRFSDLPFLCLRRIKRLQLQRAQVSTNQAAYHPKTSPMKASFKKSATSFVIIIAPRARSGFFYSDRPTLSVPYRSPRA